MTVTASIHAMPNSEESLGAAYLLKNAKTHNRL